MDDADLAQEKIMSINSASQRLRECEQKLSQFSQTHSANNKNIIFGIVADNYQCLAVGRRNGRSVFTRLWSFFAAWIERAVNHRRLLALYFLKKKTSAGASQDQHYKKQINALSDQIRNDLDYIIRFLRPFYSDVNQYNYQEVFNEFKYKVRLLYDKQKK